MKRLIGGLYAVPAVLAVGASVALMEQTAVILCGVLAFAVAVVMTCTLVGFARSRRQRLWPILVAAAACLALIASVPYAHWPLRAAYFLSRASFERLAQDACSGRPAAGPVRVGLFTVKQVEVNRHGIVCLWVDTDPAGRTGFVQCGPVHVPFNLWSMIILDDRWQFIAED
jgi:hypothetical protein